MMAVRATNYRRGDIAEAIGVCLLQGTSLVAPVPRTEDVGLDVVATLLRPDGPYRVLAENSFYVQLKAASVREIAFTGKEKVDWLLALELPLFVGSVDVAKAKIDLFACHRITQASIERLKYDEVILSLDNKSEFVTPGTTRKIGVGPAVYSWTVSDLAKTDFPSSIYTVLKPHLVTAKRNIELRRSRRFEQLRWSTGSVPEQDSFVQMGGGTGDDPLPSLLDLAMPYLSACVLEAHGSGRKLLAQKLADVMKSMFEAGASDDPVLGVLKI